MEATLNGVIAIITRTPPMLEGSGYTEVTVGSCDTVMRPTSIQRLKTSILFGLVIVDRDCVRCSPFFKYLGIHVNVSKDERPCEPGYD
jgi:hypothetical protein